MKLNKKIKLLISADGCAGSGKTTASKIIAKDFGLKLLSSGLLYRYVAYKLLISNKIKNKKKFLMEITKKITLKKLKNKNLYSPKVTQYSSEISQIKYIRDLLKNFQKKFQKNRLCIIEGRDIGTIIAPKADLKLFFTCDLKVKSKRRFKEFKKINKKISLNNVKKALKLRDLKDTKRKISPLRPAKGAVIVDTSNININQMRAKLINIVLDVVKNKYGRNI